MNNCLNLFHMFRNGIIILFIISPILGGNGVAINTTIFTNLKTFSGHTNSIHSIAWSPDGKEIASGSDDNTTKIWDATTGRNIITINGTGFESSVAWSPDGSKLATGGVFFDEINPGNIYIWDIATGVKLKNFDNNSVYSLAWSLDGKKIAAGVMNTIKIWDVTTGSNIMTIKCHSEAITSVSWSPDGSKLASGTPGIDGYVDIWNSNTGVNIKNVSFTTTSWTSVAWSPNGKNIAFASMNLIVIWDYMTNENDTTLIWQNGRWNPDTKWYNASILSIAWSPDGNMLACGDDLGKIGIWDITTDINIKNLTGHTNIVHSLAWNPDGSKLASGSGDYTIKIWGEPPPPPSPNVYVRSITSDKTNISIGDSVNITIVLFNNGAANGTNVVLNLYDSSLFLITKNLNITHGSTNSTVYFWKTIESTSLGIHIFRAVVRINEKNTTVIVTGKPNVYLKEMTVDKANITIGNNIQISAIIKNNGTADANNVNVLFYEDNLLLTIIKKNITSGGTFTVNYEWNTKYTIIGDHVLKVVVGNSSKQTTVHINKHPAIILNYSISTWLIGLIILLIAIISFILGYDTYKKRFK